MVVGALGIYRNRSLPTVLLLNYHQMAVAIQGQVHYKIGNRGVKLWLGALHLQGDLCYRFEIQ